MIDEDSRLAWWLSLPWRCKVGRHVPRVQEQWEDTGYSVVLVGAYEECERCGTFLGWIEAA